MRIVAVTACAAGIAHTYMAAESLQKAAKEAGHDIKVEIQGSMGMENRLSQADIDAADVVIWAVDIHVREADRFNKKSVFEVGPHEAIVNALGAIETAKKEAGIS